MSTKVIAKCCIVADVNKVRTEFKAGDTVAGLDKELESKLLESGVLVEVVEPKAAPKKAAKK